MHEHQLLATYLGVSSYKCNMQLLSEENSKYEDTTHFFTLALDVLCAFREMEITVHNLLAKERKKKLVDTFSWMCIDLLNISDLSIVIVIVDILALGAGHLKGTRSKQISL